MPPVLSVPPVPTGTAPVASTQAILAVLQAAPAGLSDLHVGARMPATVLGRNAAGQTVLGTEKGEVTLASAVSLPRGAQIVIEVRAAGPQPQIAIRHAHAEPAPLPAAPAAPGQLPSATGGTAAASPGGVQPGRPALPALNPGAVVGATVVQVPSPAPAPGKASGGVHATVALPGAGTGPAPAPAPVGTPTGASPLPSQSPPVAAAPPQPAAVTNQAHSAAAARSLPPPGAYLAAVAEPSLPQGPRLTSGTRVTVRVVAPSSTNAVPPNAAATSLPARVAAVLPSGQPLVQTPNGLLLLDAAASISVGTPFLLQLLSEAEPAVVPNATAAATQPSRSMPDLKGWPGLAEAAAVLRQAEPQTAEAILARALPQTGPRLAAGLSHLLSSLRRGDVRNWPGAELRGALVRAGHPELAERLQQDIAALSQAAARSADPQWETVYLPLLHDGALQTIQMHLRRRTRGGRFNDGEGAGTRFVVEVEMSRLGPMQLDGLVQPQRFDLMVRSRHLLDEPMRREITTIFDEARAATGFVGSIGFQVATVFPVTPITAPAEHTGLVV